MAMVSGSGEGLMPVYETESGLPPASWQLPLVVEIDREWEWLHDALSDFCRGAVPLVSTGTFWREVYSAIARWEESNAI